MVLRVVVIILASYFLGNLNGAILEQLVHPLAGEGGEDRGGDGDAGAGAVLRRGCLREVDVDVLILIEVPVQAKRIPGRRPCSI